MPVLENYRLRFDVEGAEKAERAFRRTGQAVQESLQKATDPKASARNLHQLEQSLNRSERELQQLRTALRPVPAGMLAVDRGARAARGGLMALSGTVPGLAAVSGVLMGPVGIVAAVGALGVASARAVPRAVAEISSMADTAERIGISAEQFQELRGSMLLMTEDANALTPALQRLQEVVGQAAGGFGEGATAFRDLGLEARTAEGEVKSLEQLLPEIAEKMKAATSQAERLAIAQRLFGEQGRAFVRVLEQGSAGLDTLAQRSRDAGIVMEESLVEQAREADAQLKLASERMGVAADTLLVMLGPSLAKSADGIADFVSWVQTAIEDIDRFEKKMADVGDSIGQALGGDGRVIGGSFEGTMDILKMKEGVSDLSEEVAGLRAQLDVAQDTGQPSVIVRRLENMLSERTAELQSAQAAYAAMFDPLNFANTPLNFTVPKPDDNGGNVPVPPPRGVEPARPPATRPTRRVALPSGVAAPAISSISIASRAELDSLTDKGEASADAVGMAFIDAFGAIDQGLSNLGVSSDTAFGRMVNGAQESLRMTSQLLQTINQLQGAFSQIAGQSDAIMSLAGGGVSLLSDIGLPGIASSVGAFLGTSTGGHGGAAALAAGVPASQSLGMFGFADGGEFTVGGGGGVDRQVVQFLSTPGEHVKITPPGQSGGGGSGPVNVSVNVQNTAAGVVAEPRQRRTANGDVEIEVLVRQVEDRLAGRVAERRGMLSQQLRRDFSER